MGRVYTIGDLHLGHKNMALYRGFSSVEEHDNHIIDCWNSVVNKKDTVIIVGDITMEKATNYHLLNSLSGFKKVVGGNHDQPQHARKLLEYVNGLCGALKYKGCLFTHIPVHPNQIERFRKNIHGHLHSEIIDDDRYVNVSCERVNYSPIEINKIL